MTETEGEIRCAFCGEVMNKRDNMIILQNYILSTDKAIEYDENATLHVECLGNYIEGKFISFNVDYTRAEQQQPSSEDVLNSMSEKAGYYVDFLEHLKDEIDNRELPESTTCVVAPIGEIFVFLIQSEDRTCHMICDRDDNRTIKYGVRSIDDSYRMVTVEAAEFCTAQDLACQIADIIEDD